jgi:hypothetical protein
MEPHPLTLPTGQQVETVAIALASAVGRAWAALDASEARTFRVMAQAALASPVAARMASIAPTASETLAEAALSARIGARALEGIDEGAIKRLFKAAADLDLLARLCDGLAVEEEGI